MWADRMESGLEQTYRKLQTNLRVGRAVSIPWRHSVSSIAARLVRCRHEETSQLVSWVVLSWAVSPQREPQRKNVVGQLRKGAPDGFPILSRRDRFLYYTRRFLTHTRHILTRISWFCVGSARLYMILWDSVWFLVGLKKK